MDRVAEHHVGSDNTLAKREVLAQAATPSLPVDKSVQVTDSGTSTRKSTAKSGIGIAGTGKSAKVSLTEKPSANPKSAIQAIGKLDESGTLIKVFITGISPSGKKSGYDVLRSDNDLIMLVGQTTRNSYELHVLEKTNNTIKVSSRVWKQTFTINLEPPAKMAPIQGIGKLDESGKLKTVTLTGISPTGKSSVFSVIRSDNVLIMLMGRMYSYELHVLERTKDTVKVNSRVWKQTFTINLIQPTKNATSSQATQTNSPKKEKVP